MRDINRYNLVFSKYVKLRCYFRPKIPVEVPKLIEHFNQFFDTLSRSKKFKNYYSGSVEFIENG